jgi:hypothetical protein
MRRTASLQVAYERGFDRPPAYAWTSPASNQLLAVTSWRRWREPSSDRAGPRRRCRRRCSHPSPRCLLARRCHSQQTRQGCTLRHTAHQRHIARREPSGGIRLHQACLPVPEDRLAPKGLRVRAAPRVPADQLDPSGPFGLQVPQDRTVLVVPPPPGGPGGPTSPRAPCCPCGPWGP